MTNEKKHKHYDTIIAWANGAQIQYSNNGSGWLDTTAPGWNDSIHYRIKPVVKSKAELFLEAVNTTLKECGAFYLPSSFENNPVLKKRYERMIELYEKALAEQEKSC